MQPKASAKRDTRFKSGASGNPRGRPYGSQNLKTIVKRELARHITITENGVPRRVTVREALEMRLTKNWSEASLPTMQLVMSLGVLDKYEPIIIEFSEEDMRA